MANVYTAKMFAHFNGGSDWSGNTCKIYKNGIETHIIKNVKTNGSPDYTVVSDYFQSGANTYDLMNRPEIGLFDWLDEQTKDMEAPTNDNAKT